MTKVLYERDGIKIQPLERSPEDHELIINRGKEIYLLLQRGILKEFAELTSAHGLLDKINNFDSTFAYALSEADLDEYDIHLAICRAYHNEKTSYFISERERLLQKEEMEFMERGR